jgi:hypothetical protein
MRRLLTAALAGVVAFAVGDAPAHGNDLTQLARSAGLSASAARGMTLDEIAAHKFSREGTDNAQPIVRRAVTPMASNPRGSAIDRSGDAAQSLDAFYVNLINRGTSGDEHQALPVTGGVSDPAARARLAASAGIPPAGAASMSLGEVAAHKFNRDSSGNNRVTIHD